MQRACAVHLKLRLKELDQRNLAEPRAAAHGAAAGRIGRVGRVGRDGRRGCAARRRRRWVDRRGATAGGAGCFPLDDTQQPVLRLERPVEAKATPLATTATAAAAAAATAATANNTAAATAAAAAAAAAVAAVAADIPTTASETLHAADGGCAPTESGAADKGCASEEGIACGQASFSEEGSACGQAPFSCGQAPFSSSTVEGTADGEVHCQVAYCSQHHLLHQVPELQSLLAFPPLTVGRTLSPINIWIGTRGTVTSLHSDPADNLLCQVAGFKYVRLYGLDQTPFLYARTMLAHNSHSAFGTSPVRVETPDLTKYPEFANAAYEETLLAPGDMLFIPKRHWHYIRSLSTSVSINMWF